MFSLSTEDREEKQKMPPQNFTKLIQKSSEVVEIEAEDCFGGSLIEMYRKIGHNERHPIRHLN